MGLIVDQRAFAYSDKDFLILEYRLINNSGDTLTNIASGLFLNWDLGIASENRSAYDPQNLALITYSKDNDLFAGVKTFFDQSPVYQALDIGDHNGNSIDLTDSISDAQKYELATNMNYDSAGMQGNGNDVANLLSQDSLVIPPYTSKKVTFLIALAIDADSLSSLLDEADSAYQKILAQPPLLETFYGCEGGTIQLNPSADSLFRFYTDPYAQNLISEGSELTVGPLSQDTVIYGVNIDGSFEGEIQRLNIVLLDNIADFSMSTDTLFLDDPQTNTVSFYDSSFFADHWEWNFDNGLQATIQHPTVNFTTPGTYEISLYVANTLGCAGERVKTLLVAERPERPVIEDLIVCENASVTLAASNTDSIAIYQNKEDVVPIMQSPETRFDRITKDTCFYVTNITGPFESLKEEVCIRVDPARSSFTYAPDTTSTENKAIFTNTSQDIYQSKWYVDGAFESTGETVSIVIDKEEYTMALVNESSYGCIDSLSRSIIFPTSPTPDTGQITACYGQEVLLSPSNGTFFAFYADMNMDSLIKKGRSLRIDSVVSKFSVFVTGLDSLLPSPVAELAIRPEQIQFSVVATPDTLILAQKRTARFETDSDSLVRWAWYKNGTFQESLSSPVLLFDSAAVYEIVLQAETALGCTVEDTLYYAVLAEEITIPLNVTDSEPVLLFPNPSNGIFSLANLKPGAEVIITNTFGK
ncbi:MAG: hypothetical protein KY428_12530, partial [Bacteroidetes bacterium]|nr:hypothetical protein [Bacteroidota bacterium]